MEFVKPIDGDVLFSHGDGIEEDGRLVTAVHLRGTPGRRLTVNGVPAEEDNGSYTARICLDGYRNAIEAVDADTGESAIAYVYWFRSGHRTYRLAVDDVIRCFENIYLHQQQYRSVFEDPYMKLLRELHDTYGTFVHLHLFYETNDGHFNISMFPDKYKAEFQANSHWLKLTFHSKKEYPRSPYKFASYEQTFREGKQVEREILRFAGPEVLAHVTSQHFADSNLWATRAFRTLGFRVMDGYFTFNAQGEPQVSYYLNAEQTAHAFTRDFWVDNREDIIFVKDDIVIDQVPLSEIPGYMAGISAEPGNCFHYLLVHEQYFYEDYPRYEPDYRERVFAAVDWCHRNGYRPVSLSDIAFEQPLG